MYVLTLSCVFLKEQWHILPLQSYQQMYEQLQTHWHALPTSELPVKEPKPSQRELEYIILFNGEKLSVIVSLRKPDLNN